MKKDEFLSKRNKFRQKSVEELLELLTSEDLKTRFFAEMALRDLSGT
ncbi:MAG: hypothetical protein ACR2MD_16195 [Aridibacter sp.]|jgi:ribosomal protein L29|nr:hypothetical protein [Acidobacteriota bacterium]